jgi:RNA polymerase sigma-70 factor (ECF subfamily)
MGETRGDETLDEAAPPGRSVTYCVVPHELAPKLHELLRRHFRRDPGVEVVVESRWRDRRGEGDRRARKEAKPPAAGDRRLIRGKAGRRAGERRAPVSELDETPALPRRARAHADKLRVLRRDEPSSQKREDLDTARVVLRFQAGDRDAYDVIYKRYFERVYGYMRVLFRDHYEAEDATSEAFAQALEALPDYERREQPFRAWLFAIARNSAVARLRKLRRIEPTDPAELDRRREEEGVQQGDELSVLDWITDRDLSLFVGRLPLPQRQVLVLRYLLDLDFAQISTLLNRTNGDVRQLQLRALRFLEERLRAVGRAPEQRTKPLPVTRKKQQSGVLRLRRFMLE